MEDIYADIRYDNPEPKEEYGHVQCNEIYDLISLIQYIVDGVHQGTETTCKTLSTVDEQAFTALRVVLRARHVTTTSNRTRLEC